MPSPPTVCAGACALVGGVAVWLSAAHLFGEEVEDRMAQHVFARMQYAHALEPRWLATREVLE
jgi:hypothetical protein